MARDTTLLELVTAVAAVAHSDVEVVRIVVDLVRSGRFQLCGTFRGTTFAADDASPERVR
jgi:hypothetical protein